MGVILPSFDTTGDDLLSATKHNALSRALRYCKAIADSPRNPTVQVTVNDGATLTGYIMHQSDTLKWAFDSATGATLKVNGNTISLGGAASGTADISGLSLTQGQVYPVTVDASGADVVVRYVYESHSETYGGGPPSFTGVSAANIPVYLNLVVGYIDDLLSVAATPPTALNWVVKETDWKRDEDSEFTVGTYWVRHTGDNFDYSIRHRAWYSQGPAKSMVRLYYNGTLLAGERTPDKDNYHMLEGTADLSGLGLTVGTFYKVEVEQEGTGTDRRMNLFCRVEWLAERAQSPAWTNPAKWAEGEIPGTDFTLLTRLNQYPTCINYLHAGAAGPSSPLYYDNFVQWNDGKTKRWMERKYPCLVYVWDGAGTAQVFLNEIKFDLPSKDGNLWYDLGDVPGVFNGSRFYVDDVVFATQAVDVSNLS